MDMLNFTLNISMGTASWQFSGEAPVNQPPVTAPDSATTPVDTPVVIDVLANDSDPEGEVLTLLAASAGTGTATIQGDDTILYTPAPGFSGTDTVSYTATDPQGAASPGSATVTVAATNQPPVTQPDSAPVFAGTPTVIDVLANDSDPEGGALSVTAVSAVSGSVTVEPDNTLLYTPAPGFSGPDTVSYTATDPQGAGTGGTLDVTVSPDMLAVTQNADGTLTVEAATGEVAITVTDPPVFAGSYTADTADLASGPVNLMPPSVSGTAEVGEVLTAAPGLWIHEGTVTGSAWQWQRDGSAIPGATAASYVVAAADAGSTLSFAETLTQPVGSRSAESAGAPVPGSFAPGDDTGLIAWYDAADSATITAASGVVSAWADKAGGFTLSETGNRPMTGSRTLGGLNALDFDGSDRLTGLVTLPASGDVAIHAVLEIDSVTNPYAAILSMDAGSDFQIDANSATQFDGRYNPAGIGAPVTLSGGPFSGATLISLIFDRTGAGTTEIYVNGALAGSTGYTSPLDSAQALHIMTNRSKNAFVDGAVGEVLVTGDVSNRALYYAYLTTKWGIV